MSRICIVPRGTMVKVCGDMVDTFQGVNRCYMGGRAALSSARRAEAHDKLFQTSMVIA